MACNAITYRFFIQNQRANGQAQLPARSTKPTQASPLMGRISAVRKAQKAAQSNTGGKGFTRVIRAMHISITPIIFITTASFGDCIPAVCR